MKKIFLTVLFFVAGTSCAHKSPANREKVPAEAVSEKPSLTPAPTIIKLEKNQILPAGVWAEKCRLMTNEAGEVVKQSPFQSLQSSYTSKNSSDLVWTVTSFKDKACSSLHSANRSSYSCKKSDNKKLGNFLCTQIKREDSSDLKSWKNKAMVDYNGYASIIKIYLSTQSLKDGTIIFSAVDSESEEGEPEILSLQSSTPVPE